MLEPLLTADDLAAVLHKAKSSILKDASRAPWRLPPITRLGSKRLLWRRQDVESFIAAGVTEPPKKRGRPRK